MLIDYLLCHLKELQKTMLKKNHRDSFSHYYVPNVEMKDFNVLIHGRSFFDLPVKSEEVANEKIIQISKNNDYTTGNLSDFAYFKENYTLIATALSKQTKLKDLQQIFLEKLKDKTME